MNQADFTAHAHKMMEACNSLLVIKGGEYAGSGDRLGNFKRGASLTGCTPLQVAFIYASKHYDAIATYVRDGAAGTDRPRSESMQGRFQDLLNYVILMAALVEEAEVKAASAAEERKSIQPLPATPLKTVLLYTGVPAPDTRSVVEKGYEV